MTRQRLRGELEADETAVVETAADLNGEILQKIDVELKSLLGRPVKLIGLPPSRSPGRPASAARGTSLGRHAHERAARSRDDNTRHVQCGLIKPCSGPGQRGCNSSSHHIRWDACRNRRTHE